MRKFLLILLGLLLIAPSTFAANCTGKTCIDVTTDPRKGGIVITATQNSPGSTTKPKIQRTPRPVKSHRPTIVRAQPKPKPTSIRSRVSTPTHHPLPRTARTFTPKVVTAVSLSDSLTRLIPMRGVYSQPAGSALTQIPVVFWTDTPPTFATTAQIFGIAVGISLQPTYAWNFGDGFYLHTKIPGSSYPVSGITHTYNTSGRYQVQLTISWSGQWSAGGHFYPVLGDVIVQNYTLDLLVTPGPTHYIQ